jgi:hypothetical protein
MWPGDDEYVGRNPEEAASITYYMRDRHVFGDFKVEIADAGGNLLSTIPGSKRKGINRISWQMRMKPPKVAPTPGTETRFVIGPTVAEGNYTVRIIQGKDTTVGTFALVGDPRSPHSAEDRALQQSTVMKLYTMQSDMAYIAEAVAGARDQSKAQADKLPDGDRLKGGLIEFSTRLDSLYHTRVATSEGFLAREEQLRERVIDLYNSVSGYGGRPSASQLARLKTLELNIGEARRQYDTMVRANLEKLNADLESHGQERIHLMTRDEFDKKQGS